MNAEELLAEAGLEDAPSKKRVFPEAVARSLLLRHRNGDSEAFSELMKLFQGPVYSYLVRAGVKPADRDDLFQEIILKIHRAREQYDGERAMFPWIFTIAVNTTRNHFRKLGAVKWSEQLTDKEPVMVDELTSADLVEARESAGWLEKEIERLNLSEREVIILVCIEHMDQAEAAKSLEIPLNTLKTHLRRGRLKLATALTRRNAVIRREVLQ